MYDSSRLYLKTCYYLSFSYFLILHGPSSLLPSWRISSFLFPVNITYIPLVLSKYIHLCFLHSLVGTPYCMITTDNISFWVFITSLKIIQSMSTYLPAHFMVSLSLTIEKHHTVRMYYIFFICFSGERHWSFSVYWTLVSKEGTIHLLNF